MKVLFLSCLLFISAFSLSLEESKHLLNRTSFGYTKAQLEFFSKLSKEQSVDFLIKTALNKDINPLPKNLRELSKPFKGLSKEQRKKARKQRNQKFKELQAWWLLMMNEPKFSFREKMTLFWHNHFVSEVKIVKNPYLMYKQNELYRNHALGNFKDLVAKSSKDLAMLIYLDSNSNKKNSPNENYARELLELFTLGEGNYTEEDIKEAARAFTGYRARKKDLSFKLVKKHHDNGIKTFMNKRGNFDGDDIIKIVLEQKQTSRFIVGKLYKEFVSYKENPILIEKIAKKFRASNYDLKVAMRELLLSEDFWANKSSMIKSPTEFIIGFAKHFDYKLQNPKVLKRLNKYSTILGQTLFNPPGVQGWSGGKAWIDASSLINRQNLIKRVLRKQKRALRTKSYSFNEFNDFFFSSAIKEDIKFSNNINIYEKYLSKVQYQIK